MSLGAVWGMFGESLLLLFAGFCLVIVIFCLHHSTSKTFLVHLERVREELTEKGSSSGFDLEELKEELLDMVHDTIGNMSPPTAIDHLLGALSGPLQMWAMRKAGIDPATGQAIQQVLPVVSEMLEPEP